MLMGDSESAAALPIMCNGDRIRCASSHVFAASAAMTACETRTTKEATDRRATDLIGLEQDAKSGTPSSGGG